jgi:serine protease Do
MKGLLIALLLLMAQGSAPSKPKAADIEQSVLKIIVLTPQNQVASIGTGFFVGNGNLIATASHVYLEAGKTIVDGSGGKMYALKSLRSGQKFAVPVQLAAEDFAHDVALLRFDPSLIKQQVTNFEIKPLELADKRPEMGDSVEFMGYFAGDDFPLLSRTLVAGFTPSPELLVLDLPANPGQSGSPVLSLETGKVVGVLSSFVPVVLLPGGLPTHSGLSRSVEVEHLKRLMESAEVR